MDERAWGKTVGFWKRRLKSFGGRGMPREAFG